jgi:hypothetical protein
MHGTYQMVRRGAAIKQGEEQFDIEIAPFTLTEPYTSVN